MAQDGSVLLFMPDHDLHAPNTRVESVTMHNMASPAVVVDLPDAIFSTTFLLETIRLHFLYLRRSNYIT